MIGEFRKISLKTKKLTCYYELLLKAESQGFRHSHRDCVKIGCQENFNFVFKTKSKFFSKKLNYHTHSIPSGEPSEGLASIEIKNLEYNI